MEDCTDYMSIPLAEYNADQLVKWGVNKTSFAQLVFPFSYTPQGRPSESKAIRVLASDIDEPSILVKMFRKGVVDPCTGMAYFDANIAAANGLYLDDNARVHTDKLNLNVYCKFNFYKMKKEIKPEDRKVPKDQRRRDNISKISQLPKENIVSLEEKEYFNSFAKNWMRSLKIENVNL